MPHPSRCRRFDDVHSVGTKLYPHLKLSTVSSVAEYCTTRVQWEEPIHGSTLGHIFCSALLRQQRTPRFAYRNEELTHASCHSIFAIGCLRGNTENQSLSVRLLVVCNWSTGHPWALGCVVGFDSGRTSERERPMAHYLLVTRYRIIHDILVVLLPC